MNQLIEKTTEYNKPVYEYLGVVDYTKTCISGEQGADMNSSREQRINEHIVTRECT